MQSGSSTALPWWSGAASGTTGGAATIVVDQFRALARANPVPLNATIARRIAAEVLGEDLVTMIVLMDPKADEKLLAFCERLRATGYGEGYGAGKADGERAAAGRVPGKRDAYVRPAQPPWGKSLKPMGENTWVRFRATTSGTAL